MSIGLSDYFRILKLLIALSILIHYQLVPRKAPSPNFVVKTLNKAFNKLLCDFDLVDFFNVCLVMLKLHIVGSCGNILNSTTRG